MKKAITAAVIGIVIAATSAAETGRFPSLSWNTVPVYIHFGKTPAAKRGLISSVELSERLRDAFLDADAIEETGAEAIDHEFESVTHRFQLGEQGFVRLKIEVR